MEWISVEDERKPKRSKDPLEELSSETVLLHVPEFAARDRDSVVTGYYLYNSKQFVPSGSHGWSEEVKHWMPLPEPPGAEPKCAICKRPKSKWLPGCRADYGDAR